VLIRPPPLIPLPACYTPAGHRANHLASHLTAPHCFSPCPRARPTHTPTINASARLHLCWPLPRPSSSRDRSTPRAAGRPNLQLPSAAPAPQQCPPAPSISSLRACFLAKARTPEHPSVARAPHATQQTSPQLARHRPKLPPPSHPRKRIISQKISTGLTREVPPLVLPALVPLAVPGLRYTFSY
jgi:hypothetical protein